MIAAVVVTHSASTGMLGDCIAALLNGGGVDRVIVVDNGGAAADLDRSDLVEVIRTGNAGYGAAANLGFERSRQLGARYVALLNDDVTVRPGWAATLLTSFDDPSVGAAQPKLLIAGSVPARVNSLGVAIGSDAAGTDIGDGTLDVVTGGQSDLAHFTGGAVIFSDRFLVDTGGFDGRWFLYYEDLDLAARGAALGWRYRLVPSAVVDHRRGATTSGLPDRTLYLQERNRLWFAFRHTDTATIGRAVWLSVRRLRHRPRGVHARALASGLAGCPGALNRRFRQRNRV